MLQRTPVAFRADATPRQQAIRAHGHSEQASPETFPPLDPSGIAIINQDRRRVSLRWLVGSVLTALSGGALIGGAIIIALQGEIDHVARPQKAATPGSSESRATVGKADRLVRREIAVSSARHEFKAPITVRVGDREVIKTRDFVRISAPLSLTAGTHARAIPPFNPLNIFAETDDGRETALRGAAPDTADVDVSVLKHPLAGMNFPPDSPGLDAEEALAQILAEERLMHSIGGASQPETARMMLSYSLRQTTAAPVQMAYTALSDAPFNDIDVRVIPENVTLLPKREAALLPPAAERDMEERIAGRPGDVILKIIADQGAERGAARAILAALELKERDRLREGQSLAILPVSGPASDDSSAGERMMIGRVTLWDNGAIRAGAALTDDGRYVPVSLPRDASVAASHRGESGAEPVDGPGAPLYESLHETTARHEVPAELTREMIPLFAADVDFQRRVGTGESLEMLYTAAENGGAPELLYVALTVEGETRRLFRFQSPNGGEIAFYDTEGRSLQKFLLRKPIAEGRLTSGFGMRYHPITNYAKMHTGVDWANRIGTPIVAAGDGTIVKAQWDSGYGRRIELQHANGYVSTYSHMSNFARGIQPGTRVRQGQVIGYLGNTGLSTGPHLHYEVMVNGRFVDPMKIKLPRSHELDGADLAEFARQREQARDLLARAQMPTPTVATP